MMIMRDKSKAQSTIEFTFALVAVMLLAYGMVQIFRWAGLDLANRRFLQDNSFVIKGNDPTKMLSSNAGDTFLEMGSVYHGTVTNGN